MTDIAQKLVLPGLIAIVLLAPFTDSEPVRARVSSVEGSPAAPGEQKPWIFVENRGQWDDSILFRGHSGGSTVWFTQQAVYYQLSTHVAQSPRDPRAGNLPHDPERNSTDAHGVELIRTAFEGSLTDVSVVGEDPVSSRFNFFLGNDPDQWRTNVPAYSSIRYHQLYAGIDLRYYTRNDSLTYDYIVAPGADPVTIRMAFERPRTLTIDSEGGLVIKANSGAIRQAVPFVYYQGEPCYSGVPGAFTKYADGVYGFDVEANPRRKYAVVIDPTLTFSTYLGGTGNDIMYALAAAPSGDVAVTGFTTSADFPVKDSIQGNLIGGWDVYVSRFSGADNSLIFSTYVGGNDGGVSLRDEIGWAVAMDAATDVYVGGETPAADFPIVNAFQSTLGDDGVNPRGDAFVLKLTASGDSLIYSTYLGGFTSDWVVAMAVDDQGQVCGAGGTRSMTSR